MYRNYSKEKIMLLKEQYKKGDIVELLDEVDEVFEITKMEYEEYEKGLTS